MRKMNIKILLNILLVTMVASNSLFARPLLRTLSISTLNEKRDHISGITFPRIQEVKYRGVNPVQMNRNKAIRAMLGDDTANMESVLHSAVKLYLMNQEVPFLSLVHNIFLSRNLMKYINKEVSDNSNVYFNEKEASQKALTIIERSIKKHIWKRGFLNLYVNYRSDSLEVWAKEAIFSTVYLEVANIYSKDIVVLDDSKKSEMLDLNYWNKVNNGHWVFTTHPWVDKGEFITPIFISYEKVVGFKEYAAKWASHQLYQDLQNNLNYAYFKDNTKNEIFIFDGYNGRSQEQAIVKENGVYYYAQSNFDGHADIPDQLTVKRDKANLIGIIKLCPEKSPCTLNSSAFKVYPKSNKEIPSSLLDSITTIKINGSKPKVFYRNAKLEASENITDLYDYKNKYSPKVYNQRLMKKEKRIKGSLSTINPKLSEGVLTYDLAAVKIDPKESIYLEVPVSIRNRAVKKVTIKHWQDVRFETSGITAPGEWDKTPAYSSVQFHSSNPNIEDKWRYSGMNTRNPKGSLFAEVSTPTDASEKSINTWYKHNGNSTEELLLTPLKFDSIRIVNFGKDPVIINKLEVELK